MTPSMESHIRKVTSGAAQGSAVTSYLWNVSYDGILRMQVPDNTFLVGYDGGIAVVIVA